MASCLVPEFPAVLVALEHLKELEKQLREDGGPLSAEGGVHLAAIAGAVSELEVTRRDAHEHLEVETIENSKLRHHIKNMSDRISEDILADVAAARASNAEEMEQLRRELTLSSRIQEESGEKLRELLEQNGALQVERERMRGENEVVVASLNDQISLRYSRQLQLDQKLEQIEELRSSIAAVEQQKASLLQSVALERQTFSEHKERLDREAGETVGEIKQWRKVINEGREELEKIKEKEEETDGRLSELSVQLAQLKSSLHRSRASRRCCEHQLQQEAKLSQELREQLEKMEEACREQEEAFSLTVRRLQEEIGRAEGELQQGRASGLLLKTSLAHVCKVFRRRHEEEKEVRGDHLRASMQLERSRLQLEERIASVVKHSKEIREMERQMKELQEEDKINRRVFESKREELRSDLDAVKSNIGRIKEEIEELGGLLEEEKIRQEEYEVKMTSDICDSRKWYEELLREEAALLQLHPESGDADLLMEQMAQSEKEHRQVVHLRQQEVQQVTTESERIGESSKEKQRELEEKERMLEQVEAEWSKRKSRHEELATLEGELKRRRSELEVLIQDTEEQTRALLQPGDDMKAELEELRESHGETLREQNAELRAVEVNIYKRSVMLEQARGQNSRTRLCVGRMADDIGTCRPEAELYQRQVQEFRRQAEALRTDLREAWRRDVSVIKNAERSDDELLVAMDSRLIQLKTRNQQLMRISSLLHQLMLEFSRRLGDKATERGRPTNSRCTVHQKQASV